MMGSGKRKSEREKTNHLMGLPRERSRWDMNMNMICVVGYMVTRLMNVQSMLNVKHLS